MRIVFGDHGVRRVGQSFRLVEIRRRGRERAREVASCPFGRWRRRQRWIAVVKKLKKQETRQENCSNARNADKSVKAADASSERCRCGTEIEIPPCFELDAGHVCPLPSTIEAARPLGEYIKKGGPGGMPSNLCQERFFELGTVVHSPQVRHALNASGALEAPEILSDRRKGYSHSTGQCF